MAKSLRDIILEALKKEGLTVFELSERVCMGLVGIGPYYSTLLRLEEEGLVEYGLAIDKWHLKHRPKGKIKSN